MCTFFLHDTLTIDIARLSLHDALPISLMFQSYPVHDGYEDPQLSNFYGQALPLLKRGIPVSTVHIENLSYSKSLEDIKVLVASYSGMKPMEKEAHKHLSEWVKNGGVVI